MSILANEIINIYGKKYFDILYDETNKTCFKIKELLSRTDFDSEMAMKLPVHQNLLFIHAYNTKNY